MYVLDATMGCKILEEYECLYLKFERKKDSKIIFRTSYTENICSSYVHVFKHLTRFARC